MDIRGLTVHEVWVERASDIAAEYYAAVVFDRSAKKPLVMLSAMGGMDDRGGRRGASRAIARLHVDPLVGLPALPRPPARVRERHRRRRDPPGRRDARQALRRVRRARRDAGRGQPADRDRRPRGDRARRQGARSTTTRSAASPRSPRCATPRPRTRRSRWRKERGITYVKLDGEIGILGNGAGLVMSTLDVVAQAGGRPANFLDVGGGAKAEEIVAGARGAALRREGEGRAVQHLRRHHALRRGRQRASSRRSTRSRSKVPIVVRLDGTNDEEGRQILAEADAPAAAPGEDDARGRRHGRRAREGRSAGVMAILVDENTKLVVQGLTGREGSLPRPAQPRVRHRPGRRRDPGQGRPGRRGRARLQHRARGRRRDRRQHLDGVRAAAVRRRRDLRGRRRGHRDDHLHHRGHPGARHAARLQLPAGHGARA